MVIRDIYPSVLQLLHQIELHLNELLQGKADMNLSLCSLVTDSKRIRQIAFTDMIKVFDFTVYGLLDP